MCAQTHIDVTTESAFPRLCTRSASACGVGLKARSSLISRWHYHGTRHQQHTISVEHWCCCSCWPPNTPDIQSLRAQGDSFPLNYAGKKKRCATISISVKLHCARSMSLQYIKAIFYIKQGWRHREEVLQLRACCQYLEAGWLFSSSWCFL